MRERALWDGYMRAHCELLEKTSTDVAPWFLVPANKKWYRNLVVARLIISISALENLRMSYPKSTIDPTTIHID